MGMILALTACTPAEPPLQAKAAPTSPLSTSIAHFDEMDEAGRATARAWMDSLVAGAQSGRLTAYDMNGENEEVVSADDVKQMLSRTDSVYTEDPETKEIILVVQELVFTVKDVVAIGFREKIGGAPGMKITKSVEAVAPYIAVRDENGNYKGLRALFWIKTAS